MFLNHLFIPSYTSCFFFLLKNRKNKTPSHRLGIIFHFLKEKLFLKHTHCHYYYFLQCKSVQQGNASWRTKTEISFSAVDPSARSKRRRTRLSKCCCRGWSWFAGWLTCIWGGWAWCTWRAEETSVKTRNGVLTWSLKCVEDSRHCTVSLLIFNHQSPPSSPITGAVVKMFFPP